jgi:5-methyltetrahydropteroyltriglutamate--homocysteine methyltransferase
MRTSRDRILTSHVGSLPRPDELIAANQAREAGESVDEGGFQQMLRASVANIVGVSRVSASTCQTTASSASR